MASVCPNYISLATHSRDRTQSAQHPSTIILLLTIINTGIVTLLLNNNTNNNQFDTGSCQAVVEQCTFLLSSCEHAQNSTLQPVTTSCFNLSKFLQKAAGRSNRQFQSCLLLSRWRISLHTNYVFNSAPLLPSRLNKHSVN